MLIEYKVRPVARYVVTRYETSGPDEQGRGSGSCSAKGEFDNWQSAYDVAYALCKDEQLRRGWPIDDERIKYPEPAYGPIGSGGLASGSLSGE